MLTICSSCRKERYFESEKYTIRSPLDSVLKHTAELLLKGEYNSAGEILLKTPLQIKFEPTVTESYIINILKAEMMYYSALPDQGMYLSNLAYQQANELNNNILKGNCENFTGLFLMMKDEPDSAKKHFFNALKLIPPKVSFPYMSNSYHVLGNIGECYLKLNKPDSTLYFSARALKESKLLKVPRATALNYWNYGEAYLQKKQFEKANEVLKKAQMELKINEEIDVLLILLSSQIKVAVAANQKAEVLNLINQAEQLLKDEKSTDYARLEFLKTAVHALESINDIPSAYLYLNDLYHLNEVLKKQETELQTSVLNKFYEAERKLFISKKYSEDRENELFYNRLITGIIVFAFLISILFLLLYLRVLQNRRRLERIKFQRDMTSFRKLKEVEEYKNRIDAVEEERNRIAKELHDDIGSSMSSVSIYVKLALEEYEKQSPKALEMLEKIRKSTLEISESLSDLIWAIYSRNDTYGNLIQKMKGFSFEVLTVKNVQLSFDFPLEIKDMECGVLIRKNVLLFFKEGINNIAKYADATEVIVEIKKNENTLTLKIKDNGKGFEVKASEHGNGLDSLKARGRALNGYTEITSHPGQGSTLMLSFPIK